MNGTIPNQTDADSQTVTAFDVSAYFSDPDTTDSLTFTASGLPGGLSINSAGEITGTLDGDASQGGPLSDGIYTITVTATDDSNASASTTFTWTVTNPAPAATDNSGAVTEDLTLSDTGNVLTDDDGPGIDRDPDHDLLFVSAVDGAAGNVDVTVTGNYGEITISANGAYTYTLDTTHPAVQALDENEAITDAFAYTISDGEGGTDSATLTITIHGRNDAPLVGGTIPNRTDTDSETVPTLDVSGYFSDPDATDHLTFSASGLPGGLSINSAGQISGTLDNDASQGGPLNDGIYTVIVTATDDSSVTVTTTFTWTVTNPAPTATDNTASVTEDFDISDSGNVLTDDDGSGIDSDPDHDPLVVSSVEGDVGKIGVTVNGTYGVITINTNGSYTYTLNNTLPAVQGLDENETLTETFAYSVSDGQDGTDSATLTITIHGRNDAPLVGGTIPSQADTDSQAVSTLDVSGYFSDPDTSDSLTFTASGLPGGLSINSAGEITGTLDSDASQGGPLNNGVYTVTITATDNSNVTVSNTFSWTVTNLVPTATDNSGSVTEDVALIDTGNVLTDDDGAGIDSDPDHDPLVVSAVDGDVANFGVILTGSYGAFTINSDGDYIYTLDNSDPVVNALNQHQTLTESVRYTVSDGQGGTDTAVLTITITGRNDAPYLASALPDQSDTDGQTITPVSITTYFADPDHGDTLTYAASGMPPGIDFDTSTGLFTGTLPANASQGGPSNNGLYTIHVTAIDSDGATLTTTFLWSVGNALPTATDNSAFVVEDLQQPDIGNVLTDDDGFGQDSDNDGDLLQVDAINGDPTAVGQALAGAYGTLLLDHAGLYTYSLNNAHPDVQALLNNEQLFESFTYTVIDGQGGFDTAVLTIHITGTNDAPRTISSLADLTNIDDEPITGLDLSVVFDDIDRNDSLTYLLSGLPDGLTYDPLTAIVTGRIATNASQSGPLNNGVYAVTVNATDTDGATASTSFTWTITNPPPIATHNVAEVYEDIQPLAFGNVLTDDDGFAIDADPDGDSIAVVAVDSIPAQVGVSLTGLYGQLTIQSDGAYTYLLDNTLPAVNSLAANEFLTESFTYTITDSQGGFSTANLTVTVHGSNDRPVAGATIPDRTDQDGVSLAPVDLAQYFSDPDTSDSLTFDATGLPTGLALNPLTGQVTGTVASDASTGGPANDGVYLVTITARDNDNASIAQTFQWTIENPPPHASDNLSTVIEDSLTTTTGNLIGDDDGSGRDSDPDSDTLHVVSVDGNPTLAGLTLTSLHGSLTVLANGSYEYRLDNGAAAIQALDNGQELSESFEYSITDSQGGFSTARLMIRILGVNDSPVVGGTIPDQHDLDAATVSPVDISGYFSDPDTTDILSFSADGLPPGLSLSSSGVITGQLPPDASQSRPASDGVYQVEITATDDDTVTVTATFRWYVFNPVPSATDNAAYIDADRTTPITGNVLMDDDGYGIDSDPDGDSLRVIEVNGDSGAIGGPLPTAYGSLILRSEGTYDYLVSNGHSDVQSLSLGEQLTETFRYVISDDEGGTSSATLTITIGGTNDAPVVVSTIPQQSHTDSQTIAAVDLSTYFGDPDTLDSLTFTATGLPIGLAIGPDGVVTGTVDSAASQDGPSSDGIHTVSATARDNHNATVTQTFDWVITNPRPLAFDNARTMTEDTLPSMTGNLIDDDDGSGSDFDPDSDPLLVERIDGVSFTGNVTLDGSYGSLFVHQNGSYWYTLDIFNPLVNGLVSGEFLTDTFEYTVTDQQGGLASAHLSITIEGVNDAPVVSVSLPDQGHLDGETIATVTVANSFDDVDSNDSLRFAATGLPGGLSLDPLTGDVNGTLEPNASQGGPALDGIYIVTVIATDDAGATASDTFHWVVGNLIPVATDNAAELVEDTLLSRSGNVITDDDGNGTDYDPDGDLFEVVAIDGDPGLVATPIQGDYGTLTLQRNGSYQYDLDNGSIYVQELGEHDSLTDRFLYAISDGEGGSGTAWLIMTIRGKNDIPQIVSNIPNTADVDGASVSGLLVDPYFVDIDRTDTLTFTAIGLPPGLTISSRGEISGTIDSAASQGGPTNDGLYTVTVTATDLLGEAASLKFDWQITNPRPFATNNTATVQEDVLLSDTGNLIHDDDGYGVDWDPDSDLLSISEINGSSGLLDTPVNGSYGDLLVHPDGHFTYTLNNLLPEIDSLGAGQQLIDTFEYTLTDHQGGTSRAILTVHILGSNDAPQIVIPIDDQVNIDAEHAATIDLWNHFNDPDASDTLTFSATGLPPGLQLDPISGLLNGRLDLHASQGGPGSDGVYPVTVTATDDNGDSTSLNFNWQVTNPIPVAFDNTARVNEDAVLSDSGNLITDHDGFGIDTDPDGDPLLVKDIAGNASSIGVPLQMQNGTLRIQSNGDYTYDLDNASPAVQALGGFDRVFESVVYTITDGDGGEASAVLWIAIDGSNDSPVPLGHIPDQADQDAVPILALATAPFFGDHDAGDTRLYTADGLPPGLMIDSTTGQITGVPTINASQQGPTGNGLYQVTVHVADSHGETTQQSFRWTITNPPPVATDNQYSTDESSAITGNLMTDDTGDGTDLDPDGDALFVGEINGIPLISGGLLTLPSGAQLQVYSDGTFAYAPDGAFDSLAHGDMATDSFEYTWYDGDGATSAGRVVATISGQAPELLVTVTDADQIAIPGASLTYAVGYSNQGDQVATGVQIDVILPEGTTFDPVASDVGWISLSGNRVRHEFSSLEPHDSGVLHLSVSVSAAFDAGVESLPVSATIADDQTHGPESTLLNNHDEDFSPLEAAPDLYVTKTDHASSSGSDELIVYTLTYGNRGSQAALGVVLTEELPAGTLFDPASSTPGWIEVSPGIFELSIGRLAAGVHGSVVFSARTPTSIESGLEEIQNTVVIADDGTNGPDKDPRDNTSIDLNRLDAAPDYRVTITDGVIQPNPGDTLVYLIEVENAGNQDGTNVVIDNVFPADVLLNVTASHQGVVNQNAGTIQWNLSALKVGESVTLTVSALVNSQIDLSTASFSHLTRVTDDLAGGADPTPENNFDSDTDQLFVYSYDSFRNEAESEWGLWQPLSHSLRVRLEPLPVDPIFSGIVEPGSTLVGRIYDSGGNMIGEQQVVADTGGNWLMSFPNSIIFEHPHRMEIVQTRALYNTVHDSGMNLRRYFHPAIHTTIYFTENLTVNSVMQNLPSEVLRQMHQANSRPLGLGWLAHSYELNMSSSSPGQQ